MVDATSAFTLTVTVCTKPDSVPCIVTVVVAAVLIDYVRNVTDCAVLVLVPATVPLNPRTFKFSIVKI